MTRIGTAIFGTVLALGMTPALHGDARAAETRGTVCGVQKSTCVETARVTKLACKETCQATSDATVPSACLRGCSSAFRTAKTNCRFEHRGCLDGCGTPVHAGGCVGGYARDLAACVQGVTGTARACLASCKTAENHRACVGGCTASLRQGTAACRSDFKSCKDACGGSPGGAFAAE